MFETAFFVIINGINDPYIAKFKGFAKHQMKPSVKRCMFVFAFRERFGDGCCSLNM